MSAGKDAAVADDDYMSTKLIYFSGSQSDQPSITVINRRFVLIVFFIRYLTIKLLAWLSSSVCMFVCNRCIVAKL